MIRWRFEANIRVCGWGGGSATGLTRRAPQCGTDSCTRWRQASANVERKRLLRRQSRECIAVTGGMVVVMAVCVMLAQPLSLSPSPPHPPFALCLSWPIHLLASPAGLAQGGHPGHPLPHPARGGAVQAPGARRRSGCVQGGGGGWVGWLVSSCQGYGRGRSKDRAMAVRAIVDWSQSRGLGGGPALAVERRWVLRGETDCVVLLELRDLSFAVLCAAVSSQAPVNALAWAPHSAQHICTAGDDSQVCTRGGGMGQAACVVVCGGWGLQGLVQRSVAK